MYNTLIIDYLGKEAVTAAVADYFTKNGLSEDVRDELMLIAINEPDRFFEMVSQFLESNHATD